MKKFLLFTFALSMNSYMVCSQITFEKLKDEANKVINKDKSITKQEIINGLKEALTIGTNKSASKASKVDGFFKNTKIKIFFPPEAVKMEKKLRQIGMGNQVDKFILTLNRAAEEASKEAASIFINAIRGMTISDGIGILKGADNAATQYLKEKTSADLKVKFKPVVHRATQKAEVTKYWKPLVTKYNKIPFVEKLDPDIEEYATQKALDGLFTLIAQEELEIRKNPLARVTELLIRVFGRD